MKNLSVKKLALAGMFCALAVVGSVFSFPIFGSKCAPVQHMVNILCAVLLGPYYGVGVAFVASLLRNLLGLGSLMAFPGSMFGALLCGLTYHKAKQLLPTLVAEVFGTSILGGLCAYPVAILLMGKSAGDIAFYAYIIPFLVSTAGGAVIAGRQTLPQQVEAALKGGATCVQLREKHLDDADMLAEAKTISALCRAYHVPFILNDNVPLAKLCGADGVHVGQDDLSAAEARRLLGPDKIIGVSAHNVAEAKKAFADGADYLGCGAMFPTHTKTDTNVISRQVLADVCASVPIPVVAIGGIHRENLLQLAGCGEAGIAVISAIFAQPDIEAACRELREMVRKL